MASRSRPEHRRHTIAGYERLPDDRRQSGFLGGAPDLAVEILSPSNTASGIREKVHDFLSAGARLVWVVDPETERVFRYRTREPPRILAGDDVLDAGPVLPGFRVPVARIFE